MEKNLADLLKKRLLEKTALDTTYESETGAILRLEMANVIADAVYQLAGNYKTLTHTELIALCARIDGILQVSDLLKNAHLVKAELKERLEE
jgi:hypothetical protein